jgi:hypothetical protein
MFRFLLFRKLLARSAPAPVAAPAPVPAAVPGMPPAAAGAAFAIMPQEHVKYHSLFASYDKDRDG